eukprot:3041213-Prymnesium_polylepis.1
MARTVHPNMAGAASPDEDEAEGTHRGKQLLGTHGGGALRADGCLGAELHDRLELRTRVGVRVRIRVRIRDGIRVRITVRITVRVTVGVAVLNCERERRRQRACAQQVRVRA